MHKPAHTKIEGGDDLRRLCYKRLLIVAVLSLGLSLPAVAYCQEKSPSPDQARQKVQQSFVNRLATELHTDVGKAEKALQAASNQALQEAVSQNLVPPEEAKRLQTGIDQGKWWLICKTWRGNHRYQQQANFRDITSILGMTTEQLQQQLQAGQSLEAIAESKGITGEQLHQRWLAAKKKELDKAVKAGHLTPEKSKEIYAALERVDFSQITAGCHQTTGTE
jgi:hypothetical protein